jgi:hypothetical protein
MYPESTGRDEMIVCEMTIPRPTAVANHRIFRNNNMTKTQSMRNFFETLLYASACLQYAVDQYTYSLYGIESTAQESLEAELKLEVPEGITDSYPRWNGNGANGTGHIAANGTGHIAAGEVVRGYTPVWSEQLLKKADQTIVDGEATLERKRATTTT